MNKLTLELSDQMTKAKELDGEIKMNLRSIGYEI